MTAYVTAADLEEALSPPALTQERRDAHLQAAHAEAGAVELRRRLAAAPPSPSTWARHVGSGLVDGVAEGLVAAPRYR